MKRCFLILCLFTVSLLVCVLGIVSCNKSKGNNDTESIEVETTEIEATVIDSAASAEDDEIPDIAVLGGFNEQQAIFDVGTNTWYIYAVNSEDIHKPRWNGGEYSPGFGLYWKALSFNPDHSCFIYDGEVDPVMGGLKGTWNIIDGTIAIKADDDYYADYYDGKYTFELTEERYLTLYQNNKNVYKCTRDDIPYIGDTAAFLSKGGNTELRGEFDSTLLSLYISRGEIHDAELLLDAGASVHARSVYGQTALHYAAAMGFASIVSKLLSRGADINAKDKWGQTPLDMTSMPGVWPYPEVNEALTEKILRENGAEYGVLSSK